MRRHFASLPSAPHRGFTLIEIAVVIVVLSLLLAMIAGIATAMLGQQRREATRQKMVGAETAIALFVSQNQRLPCPADGTQPSESVSAGIEQRPAGSCSVTQANGVLPWRTLGLSEQDATDGWGTRLTFRVANDFVADASMNFTSCDPGPAFAGGGAAACNASCPSGTYPTGCTHPSEVTKGKGLRICNLAGVVVMNPLPATAFNSADTLCSGAAASPEPPSTGAAYVLISHGENRHGGFNDRGVRQDASGNPSSARESVNHADLAIGTYYVSDIPNYTNQYFDDFVIHPSILAVATKAQLGPRAH